MINQMQARLVPATLQPRAYSMITASQRRIPRAFLLILLLSATGCTTQLMPTPNIYVGSSQDAFDEVPAGLQTNKVEMIYVTDRARVESTDDYAEYGTDRSNSLAYGICTVSIGKDVSWPELVEDSRRRDRKRDLTLRRERLRELGRLPETPLPVVRIGGELRDDPAEVEKTAALRDSFCSLIADRVALSPERREAYVLIHGFNNSLEDAAFVMTGIWHFLGRQGIPIIYTWPAGRSYAYDRESGEFTVFHLKQLLRGLASCPSLDKIHIIAHSRGTDVALTALRELNLSISASGKTTAKELKLGHVVLAAPDLDLEVVSQRIGAEKVDQVPERMTVYTSKSDRAIGAAELLFKSGHRLGDLSPEDLTPAQRLKLACISKLEIILARVSTGLIGHDYFHSNPAVSSDLILMLRDDKCPGEKDGRPLKEIIENFWAIEEGYPQQVKE